MENQVDNKKQPEVGPHREDEHLERVVNLMPVEIPLDVNTIEDFFGDEE